MVLYVLKNASCIAESLRIISEEQAHLLNVKPRQKWCESCRKRKETDAESAIEEDFDEPAAIARDSLNTSTTSLGCSPVKPVRKRDRVSYGKRKMTAIKKATKAKVSKVLEVPEEELSSEAENTCNKCKDLDRIVYLIKEKCENSTKKEKVKFLTLAPPSLTIKKTAEEFNVSAHLVRKARELRSRKES